jgi:hypothetical protein
LKFLQLKTGDNMKVKVGNIVTDGKHQPVMVILSPAEREQIAQMAPEATKYCVYPNNDKNKEWTADDFRKIKQWMDEV